MEDWAAVQRVYRSTKSQRQTAKLLGISRNTVSKLLALKEPPTFHRSHYTTKIDEYKDQIIEWRCKPFEFNGTRILKELRKIGYTGSISPIYRFLRKLEENDFGKISSRATVRIETPPGDQAQFDWTEYNVNIAGKYRKVYCFSMILSASRKKAVCCSLTIDAEAIYEAIQELFEDLGGVTLELLIDNPRALVTKNNPKSEEGIKYNTHALMMARHLGTELNACPCYWPRKKGKIERPFKYIEEQFVKGNRFSSMEDLNSRLKHDVAKWCDEKHTTTQRIPNQHFELEEKDILMPVPNERYRIKPLTARKISNDSFINVAGNKYSVPVKYVGKTLYYRIVYGFRIEIFDKKGKLIKRIEQTDQSHQVMIDQSDYEAIAPRTSTSIPQIKRDFTKKFVNGDSYLEAASKRFTQPAHYAKKIMELEELYSIEVLDKFIGIAVDSDMLGIKEFKKMLREYNCSLLSNKDEKAVPKEKKVTQPEDPLTRNCSYYEDLY